MMKKLKNLKNLRNQVKRFKNHQNRHKDQTHLKKKRKIQIQKSRRLKSHLRNFLHQNSLKTTRHKFQLQKAKNLYL